MYPLEAKGKKALYNFLHFLQNCDAGGAAWVLFLNESLRNKLKKENEYEQTEKKENYI